MRLDQFLVQHKNIESRTKAQDLILNRNIFVNNKLVIKSSFDVTDLDTVEIQSQEILKYVSRAGLKLEGAIIKLDINLKNTVVLDIGQSTGGFTDCCLQQGAAKIIGFDVGEGQLHQKIKTDSRVTFFEKLNVKNLSMDKSFLAQIPVGGFDLLICDVSFISLQHVVPNIHSYLKINGEYLFLIKPQFECGPENLDKNGIVKKKSTYLKIETEMKNLFNNYFGTALNYFESNIRGKEGNLEFFIYGRNVK